MNASSLLVLGGLLLIGLPVSASVPPVSDIVKHAAWVAQMKKTINSLPISRVYLDLNLAGPPYAPPVSTSTIYNLGLMKVVQKVAGGYLIQAGGADPVSDGFVFLETDEDFPEDYLFLGTSRFAVCLGPYEYAAVNGFKRTIPKMHPLPPEANAYVMERLQLGH